MEKLEIFNIYSDQIRGRLDSYFYCPEFIELEKEIENLVYKKLKDIVEDVKNGSTPEGGKFDDSGIPYFRSQDFTLFDLKVRQFINTKFHKKIKRSSIKPGDVLLAIVGATLGVVGYVPEEMKEGNINQNVARIRVRKDIVNPEYLAFFLASKFGQKQIYRQATVTTQAYLNNEQLNDIKIVLPKLKIQNKIVQIMRSAYDEREKNEIEAQKLLDSIDDYVLGKLGIKFPEIKDEMCFEVRSDEVKGRRLDVKPYQNKYKNIFKNLERGEYKTVFLKDIILDSVSGEWGSEQREDVNDVFCNVIRNTNFDNKFNLDFSKIAKRFIKKNKLDKVSLQKDDILIEKSGGSPVQPVGRVAMLEKLFFDEPVVFSNFLQRIRIDKDRFNPFYVFSFLKVLHSKGYTEHLQNQTTGIKNLIMGEFLSIPIPTPDLRIQKEIAIGVLKRMKLAKKKIGEGRQLLDEARNETEKMILGGNKA